MKSTIGRFGPIVLGVGIGLLFLAQVALGTQPSAEVEACGGKGNGVLAEFKLDHASDIWAKLPAMLQTPELEVDQEPAHVVVFDDGFKTRNLGWGGAGGKKPETLDGVVCVIQSDGTMNIYSSVSRAGSVWAP